jgi:hypothetical protein
MPADEPTPAEQAEIRRLRKMLSSLPATEQELLRLRIAPGCGAAD